MLLIASGMAVIDGRLSRRLASRGPMLAESPGD
jgi:hypothetical protein